MTTSDGLLMDIKARVKKIKAWLKEKFKRKRRLRQRLEMVEEAMTDLIKHGLQQDGFDRESRVKMIETLKSHLKDEASKLIEKEKKNRIASVKVSEKRAVEKCTKEFNEAIARVEQGQEIILNLHKRLSAREDNLDGLMSTLRNKLTDVDGYLANIKMIEGLADSAKSAYDKYLNNLKRDISEFEVTHQVTRRMASVETRITQLEIGHNGSGKKTSGTARANQD